MNFTYISIESHFNEFSASSYMADGLNAKVCSGQQLARLLTEPNWQYCRHGLNGLKRLPFNCYVCFICVLVVTAMSSCRRWKLTLGILVLGVLAISVHGEVYTALAEMEELLETESVLISNLEGYIRVQEDKLSYLKT